jgi:hypothetical protein
VRSKMHVLNLNTIDAKEQIYPSRTNEKDL